MPTTTVPRVAKTCAYEPCSRTFDAKPKQRYCCRGHKERARQQRREHVGQPIPCAWCSKAFTRTVARQRYCSTGCQWAAARAAGSRWHLAREDPRSRFDLRCGLITEPGTGRSGMEADYQRAIARDPCAYCGAPGGHLDHIVPRNRGGTDRDNLTAACSSCNTGKRALPMLHFLLAEHIKREIAQDTRAVLILRGISDTQGRMHVARAA